jgi:hypothetical protein
MSVAPTYEFAAHLCVIAATAPIQGTFMLLTFSAMRHN